MIPAEQKSPELSPELILRARQGDRQAMTELYEATSQEIYRTVHAMVRNEDLTLDIQQDTYVTAFSHLDQLRDPGAFRAWLRQIAVNQVRTQLRKKNPTLFTELEPETVPDLPEPEDLRPESSPELALDRKETSRLVREILGSLSDSQRLLVGMYYYEEIPLEQIAGTLELSPGTVKTQLYRSRRKIEAAVRRLEAQGVKLYGLGPLPFLLALLRRLEPPEQAKRRALAGILSGAGDAAATALGESALSTSAVTLGQAGAVGLRVGRSFFQTLGGKLLLGGLTALALGGGIAGYRAYTRSRPQPPGDWQPEVTLRMRTPVESDESPVESPKPLLVEKPVREPETDAPLPPASDTAEQPASSGTAPAAETPTAPRETAANPQPTQTEEREEQTAPSPSLPAQTEPAHTETTQTESPAETVEAVIPSIVSCLFGDEPDPAQKRYFPGQSEHMVLLVQGNVMPIISTDNPAVLQIGTLNFSGLSKSRREYWVELRFLQAGNAALSCYLDGEIQRSYSIEVHGITNRFLRADLGESGNEEPVQMTVGSSRYLYLLVEGDLMPTVSVEGDSVLRATYEGYSVGDSETAYLNQKHRWLIEALAPGDARVNCYYEGELVASWELHTESPG